MKIGFLKSLFNALQTPHHNIEAQDSNLDFSGQLADLDSMGLRCSRCLDENDPS
jgi:hypothetical protein